MVKLTILTFSLATLSIMVILAKRNINNPHLLVLTAIMRNAAFFVFMPSVVMPSVVIPSAVMPSVIILCAIMLCFIMLNVVFSVMLSAVNLNIVAPKKQLELTLMEFTLD
jgi:hypothetical protein